MNGRPGMATRDDLLSWANTVPAQTEFPRLVRRLIMETCPGATSLGFPAGTGAALGKWDGSARTTKGNAFVPDGLSIWELSVGKNLTSKADSDYDKRTDTPDGSATTDCEYIQAILRPWGERNSWAVGKLADRRWKNVRAYGVDDIETWLEIAPVTHAWISEMLGLNPYGYRAAESWWQGWSNATTPALPYELIVAGREDSFQELEQRLTNSPTVTSIKAGSLEEVAAFIAGALRKRASDGNARELSRAAFVDDPRSWRALEQRRHPLVLVPVSPTAIEEVRGVADVHHIIVPVFGGAPADIDIPPVDAKKAAAALSSAGMKEERRTQEAGQLARRSIVALRRHLAIKPELHTAPWAAGTPNRAIRGILLAGRWRDDVMGDRDTLSELTGAVYDSELSETLSEFSDADDPFVSRIGPAWILVSPHDAWLQLRSRIRRDDLIRFEPIAQRVLLEEDPVLGMRQEDRWRASLDGKVRVYSTELRKGLAATVAMLGVHGELLEAGDGVDGRQTAARLVRHVLATANSDTTGTTWNSIADLLSRLAEAAPDQFLEAVETGSAGDTPVLLNIFNDQVGGDLWGSTSRHSNLLWALERLAWSPMYLGRVVQALSRLSEIDPGGTTADRPFSSLSSILWPYHPETTATERSRIAAIDAVRRYHPTVGWRLLLSVLPEMHAFHMHHPEPEFRDWKSEPLQPISIKELIDFTALMVERLLEDVGTSPGRWIELFEKLSDLPPSDRARIRERLRNDVETQMLSDEGRDSLWDSLRSLVSMHRTYSDSQWAMSADEVDQIEQVANLLEPTDAIGSHAWLFREHRPDLPDVSSREDFAAYDEALRARRAAAVTGAESLSGFDGVVGLATEALPDLVFHVGIGLADAAGDTYMNELLQTIGADDSRMANLSWGWIVARIERDGWTWAEQLLQRDGVDAAKRARVLLATRDFPKAWERADELGTDVASFFWRDFSPYGLGSDFAYRDVVVGRLVQEGRVVAAVRMAMLCLRSGDAPAPEMIVSLLSDLLNRSIDDPNRDGLERHDVTSLLGYLNDTAGPDLRVEVARLEWAFLPLLGHDPELGAIKEALRQEPEFFVQLIEAIYARRTSAGHNDDSARDGEGVELAEPELMRGVESQEERSRRAVNAYRLLKAFDRLPGMGENGELDGGTLRTWVTRVLELATELDRREAAEEHVGTLLSRAPEDSDGTWPCQPVRDLIEELQSAGVETGFLVAVFNSRGATTRAVDDGGVQEQALVDRYRRMAGEVADGWPRTAALLRSLATSYEADARQEERSAERFRRGFEH